MEVVGAVVETIRITLETLYDILRNEKKKEDLQKLEDTFYLDVGSYLREKKALLESKAHSSDIFAAGEREKLESELRSIRRIIKELYEKREKKIIDIALNRSRTGSDIIDTSAMLREETGFYQDLLQGLDLYRRGILMRLIHGELPLFKEPSAKETMADQNTGESTSDGKTRIRFVRPTPSFVWKDLKKYGPYDPGEETEMFPEVAELLVRKGRAEKIM